MKQLSEIFFPFGRYRRETINLLILVIEFFFSFMSDYDVSLIKKGLSFSSNVLNSSSQSKQKFPSAQHSFNIGCMVYCQKEISGESTTKGGYHAEITSDTFAGSELHVFYVLVAAGWSALEWGSSLAAAAFVPSLLSAESKFAAQP